MVEFDPPPLLCLATAKRKSGGGLICAYNLRHTACSISYALIERREIMEFLPSLKIIYIIISAVFLFIIGYFWFYRICRIIDSYLEMLYNIIDCKPIKKRRLLPLYSKNEARGTYKGREVIAGVQYAGLGFEWMPLPHIRIKLKDVIRYNYNRIPDFAFIKSGWLVFKIKERLAWGVFDKNYNRFFTKEFIIITLTRLLAVAEDAERGKTLGEIFK